MNKFCCFKQNNFHQKEKLDRYLNDYLKTLHIMENERDYLQRIMKNVSEFQSFLHQMISKPSFRVEEDNFAKFHPKIINLIFHFAKVGIFETSKLMNESAHKNVPNMEAIRDINDDNNATLENILSDMSTQVQTKVKINELSKELSHELNDVKQFDFTALKEATNYFDEGLYEGNEKSGRQLGPGRIGKVFLGTNLIENTPFVVIKRVSQDYKYIEQFFRELKVISQLKHPNIIQLIGYSVDELPCLVYEYIPNGSLKHFLETLNFMQDEYSAKNRLNTLLQVASALKYLHYDKNIAHGDIKPENILIDKGVVKLCGFGLSCLSNSDQITKRIASTNFYMAPERAHGQHTISSDVYSFGVTMMEVLTGLLVFDCHRNEAEHYLPQYIARLINESGCENDLYRTLPRLTDEEQESYFDTIKLSLSCAAYESQTRPTTQLIHEKLYKTFGQLRNWHKKFHYDCSQNNRRFHNQ